MREISWTLVHAREVPEGDAWLGPGERALLAPLTAAARRASFRLGRFAARRLLGEAVEVLPDAAGAPCAYRAGEVLPVTVSLSHRDGAAVCAAAGGGVALGCDLERIEPRSTRFIHDFFTPTERAAVAHAADAAMCANAIWSAKESALKALRVGLQRDTWELEVTLRASSAWNGSQVRLCHVGAEGSNDAWRDLSVQDLAGGSTFCGALLCTEGYVITLVCDARSLVG